MPKFQPPKGTRDFMPAEMFRRRQIFDKTRQVLDKYGYGEVCTPAFEDLELLTKKSGPDLEKEIYVFEDKSGRKLGLRFDLTVPICRIVSSDSSIPKPIKLYFIGNMWRYDQPQAGRWREFWQIDVELIGSNRPEADAEILSVVSDILKTIGIKKFYFRINSRKIVEALVKQSGIPENKKFDAFRAIDKLSKIGEKEVKKEMERYGISASSAEKLLQSLRSEKVSDSELNELKEIKKTAEELGVDNIKIDFSIVRGIDYYTGFVFETFVDGFENLGSVASGGRYDSLIGLYGGDNIPATGVGIGIDRLLEVVKENEEYYPVKIFFAVADNEVRAEVLKLVQELRKSGISVDTDIMGRDLRKQLSYANSMKISYVIVVGNKELKSKKFKLKDMKTGKEQELSISEISRKLL